MVLVSCMTDYLWPVRRKNYFELGELPGLRIILNAAPVLFHDEIVAYRNTEPGTFTRRFGRVERIEYIFCLFESETRCSCCRRNLANTLAQNSNKISVSRSRSFTFVRVWSRNLAITVAKTTAQTANRLRPGGSAFHFLLWEDAVR